MEISPIKLTVKRPIAIKAIVTPQWKEDAQTELQAQMNRLDRQIQQLEAQGQRALAEIERQSLQPMGPEAKAQVESIKSQVNERKAEMLEQKNQLLQQLTQVQTLELDQEVNQGQLDSYFTIEPGDNLIEKMQVEIVIRDGIVEEIRGAV